MAPLLPARVLLAGAACATLAGAVTTTLLAPGLQLAPVPFTVNGSTAPVAFASVSAMIGASSVVSLLARNASSTTGPWLQTGVVATARGQGTAVGSATCVQPSNGGAIVCAYQAQELSGAGSSIQVAASSDSSGVTWATIATVASTSNATGVWAPFLYAPPAPAGAAGPVLRVLYSADQAASGDAWLVQAESRDGGTTWAPMRAAAVSIPGARLRASGVTALADGSLLLPFERAPTAGGGGAWVQAVRSFDGGATWGQLVDVFAPPAGTHCSAGAPSAAVCLLTDKVNVVFVTDLPTDGSPCTGAGARLGAASLGLVAAFLNATNASAPLDFAGSPVARVPTVGGAPVAGPSVFVDLQSDGGRAPCGGRCTDGSSRPAGAAATIPTHTMRVAYFTPGGGAGQAAEGAYLTDGTLCLS